jgi:transposase
LENFSARHATRLFVCHPDDLDETQQTELALIKQASPSAQTAYHLTQAFMQMIREQSGHQLDAWLSEAEASHLPELKSFAKGIQQDKAAVLAGLTLPWSNGPLEGHINRLKLIKRSMYGRAKLPLLRQRVLHHSKNAKEGKGKRSHVQKHIKKSSTLAPALSPKPFAVPLGEVA